MPLSEPQQLAQLRTLLNSVLPGNPFYRAKIGNRIEIGSTEEFAARVPFTVKSELIADQAAHPPYGSNLTFPIECYSRFSQTSGSTGRPVRWLDTAESWA